MQPEIHREDALFQGCELRGWEVVEAEGCHDEALNVLELCEMKSVVGWGTGHLIRFSYLVDLHAEERAVR